MVSYLKLWQEADTKRHAAEQRLAIYERIHANAASRDFLAAALRVIERHDLSQEFVDEISKPKSKE